MRGRVIYDVSSGSREYMVALEGRARHTKSLGCCGNDGI